MLSVMFSACVKDKLDTSLINRKSDNPVSAIVPVGFLSSSLENIFAEQLKNGTLTKDSAGLFWLKYTLPFDTLKADSLIQFADKSATYSLKSSKDIDLSAISDSLVLSDTFYVDWGFSNGTAGEELDSIRLLNMQLVAELTSSYALNARFSLIFLSFTFHQKKYSKSLIINSNNNFSDFKDISISLGNNALAKNRVPLVARLVLLPSAGIISANSSIFSLKLNFNSIDYTALYGYLGQMAVNLPEAKTFFDFYHSNFSGSFHFEHASLNFFSDNSMGFPLSFYLSNISAITADKTTRQIVLSDELTAQNPAEIAYPSLLQEGSFVKDSTSIDISGLQLFTDNYATEIHAQLQGKINPEGKTAYNFLHKSDCLNLNLQFAIPVWGYTNNLVMQDTLSFVLKDFYPDDYSQIERLLFVLNFTNRFPVDAYTQIYFFDKNNAILDSLFDIEQLIASSSKTDGDGKILANELEPIKAYLNKESVQNIENTSYIIMKSRLRTIDYDNSPPVSWKFFGEYYMSLQLGVAAEIGN